MPTTKQETSLNQLIKYVYKEDVNEQENSSIEKKLMQDENLQEDFFELLYLKKQLDEATYEPNKRCIENVMAYSRSLNSVIE